MYQRLDTLQEKKLVGKKSQLSFAENKTAELWQKFMPHLRHLQNKVGLDLYSIEVYDPLFFQNFNVEKVFDKWAAVEVTNFEKVPDELETFILPGGLYAVFLHKGAASEGAKTYEYIFRSWLPQSEFSLDDRPHFAIMGVKYKNNSADSEEEIWIPVKSK